MPAVISDTSPLRALAHLALVDLLWHLYGQVLVPPAVQWELANPAPGLSPVDISQFSFIQVQAPRDQGRVQAFRQQLDAGESEALALALEIPITMLLVDELAARSVAQGLGLPLTGTLGVLLLGKAAGLMQAVRPLMDRLENEINFFISPRLRADILRRTGEQP